MTRRFQDFPADNSDERRQFNNQVILKSKNLDLEVRNAVKLVEQIYQLESETTRLVMMIYLDLVKLMTSEIPEPDIDEEGFDDENDNSDAESIFTADQSLTDAVNSSRNQSDAANSSNSSPASNATNPPASNEANPAQNLSMQSDTEFDAKNINDFLLRIKEAYKKNKRLQTIMKAKKDGDRKISAKFIEKRVRLELDDCEIKHELF